MSIQQNFPNTRPSLNLNFARSKTLDPRITFTRSQTGNEASYVDESGIIRYASADEPRFDHDPETGECLGLLIEGSRQNLLSFSDSFMSGTGWGTASGTREENVGVSPDGTTTADKIISTGGGVFRAGITVSNATAYTYSIFIKNFAGTGRITALGFERFGSTVVNAIIDIDLISGTILSSTANVSSSSILLYPNGWYRVSVTTTSVDTTATVVNYTSISGNEYLLWGVQFEQGSFPTSYIPTTASTVTRNPDNASITRTNFSSWYNQSEGTFYVSSRFYADGGAGQLIFQIDNDGNANKNGITFRNELSGNQIRPFDVNYSASPAGFDLWTHTGSVINTDYKTAFALKSNDMAAVTNYPEGSLGLDSSTSRILQEKTTLRLGSGISNISPLNGHISQLTYYPRRLTNTQLQNLTK